MGNWVWFVFLRVGLPLRQDPPAEACGAESKLGLVFKTRDRRRYRGAWKIGFGLKFVFCEHFAGCDVFRT